MIFSLSLVYSFVLTFLIPVDSTILDRMNYIEYASTSDIILFRYFAIGNISILTNEPIWLIINIILNQFFQPEAIVRFIIFFASFTSSYLILKSNFKFLFLSLLILLFPNVLIKYIIHIRQGLAISIFLLGWFSSLKTKRYILFSITPLIHSSFFFVLILYFLTKLFRHIKLSIELSLLLITIFGFLTSYSISHLSNMLGARQGAEYNFNITQVSGMGFVFWLLIFCNYWLQGKNFVKSHLFAMSTIIFYLTTYFLIDVTSRVFESLIIIVLLAGLELTNWRKFSFFCALILFVGISWILSLNKFWFGWGIN